MDTSQRTCLMLMKLDSSIISNPVRHWPTKVNLAMTEQNQSGGSLFCWIEMLMAWRNYLHWWLASTTNPTASGGWNTPNTQQIPVHGWLQPLLRSFMCCWIAREVQKQKNLALHWPLCCTARRYHCSEKY